MERSRSTPVPSFVGLPPSEPENPTRLPTPARTRCRFCRHLPVPGVGRTTADIWVARPIAGDDDGGVLRAEGLEKRYGDVEALRGADLTVAAGEIVALLGRNGAGKTTMLSIVAGLLEPDAGSVDVDGVDVLDQSAAAADLIGIAPQETGIYRVLTVRENLEFFGEMAGLSRAARRARATEVAAQLGLERLLDRRATDLSGGEARRLHTACALVHTPPLLLLDEPTVGADVSTRNQLIDAVRALADRGAAVVYTTHYLPEVEALEADIVVIDDGRVLARGTREELIAEHGRAGIDLEVSDEFDPSDLAHLEPTHRGGRRWHLEGEIDLGGLAAELGPNADRVLAFERTRPDVEQVFLSITGRSLDESEDDSEVLL